MFRTLTNASDLQALGLGAAHLAYFERLRQPAVGVLLYCDGACSGNSSVKESPGGWGALVLDGNQVKAGHHGSRQTTNNKMELSAAIEGLRQVPAGTQVLLRTDSQYVIKGCTEWRSGWERKGMKNSKGQEVANQELWHALWAEVDARRVRFEWVKGHNGDPGNELADALANLGVAGQR